MLNFPSPRFRQKVHGITQIEMRRGLHCSIYFDLHSLHAAISASSEKCIIIWNHTFSRDNNKIYRSQTVKIRGQEIPTDERNLFAARWYNNNSKNNNEFV